MIQLMQSEREKKRKNLLFIKKFLFALNLLIWVNICIDLNLMKKLF
jgi:hypothetical protein